MYFKSFFDPHLLTSCIWLFRSEHGPVEEISTLNFCLSEVEMSGSSEKYTQREESLWKESGKSSILSKFVYVKTAS